MKRRRFIRNGLGAAGAWSLAPGIRFDRSPSFPFAASGRSDQNPEDAARIPPHRPDPVPKQRPEAPTAPGITALVLGTAQDGGLPQPGCACGNCRRARRDPGFARKITSLALLDRTAGRYVLIEATPDIRPQMESAGRRLPGGGEGSAILPSGVILTHAHIGHYTGLMFFGYEAASTRRLPVWASASMNRFLRGNGPWSQLVKLENIDLRDISRDRAFSPTPGIEVTGFPVPHRDEFSDTLGLRIRGPRSRLLFIPDIQRWEEWERPIEEEVRGVDVALLDGTFFGPGELPGRDLREIGHPLIRDTLTRLAAVVSKNGPRVLFTHLNHGNPALRPESEERRRIKAAGFEVAEDGMEFPL